MGEPMRFAASENRCRRRNMSESLVSRRQYIDRHTIHEQGATLAFVAATTLLTKRSLVGIIIQSPNLQMEAKQNDVLSGRGACFNYHPGNKKFRTILETYMDAYTTGTKKRKMMISKAIVEAIYSMQPPGRFLKKCTDTGQWRELTRREAADKAAQAMAYAVRTSRKAAKKQSSIPLVTTTSQPPPPPFIGDGLAGGSSSPKTKAQHVPTANLASDWGTKWDTTDASSGADHDNDGGREELFSRNSSHQQQLLRFQQTSRSATLPTTSAGAPTID
eukprot:scaffold4735_cov104-Skeletonema_dohrnii-CCMP3373.AAC.6